MAQVSVRLPDEWVQSLDKASQQLRKSRAEILRSAVELYLSEYQDLDEAISRLRDPEDPVLDWEEVRGELLAQDEGHRLKISQTIDSFQSNPHMGSSSIAAKRQPPQSQHAETVISNPMANPTLVEPGAWTIAPFRE